VNPQTHDKHSQYHGNANEMSARQAKTRRCRPSAIPFCVKQEGYGEEVQRENHESNAELLRA
jgi:hypothetical protein